MPGLCIIPQRAMRDKECRGNRLVALCAIGSFTSRDGGGVWAANETIAESCVLDDREFRRAAAWLVERGYVRKKVRYKASGAQDTNLLQVVLDEPEEAGQAGGGEKVPTPRGGEGEKSPPPEGEKSPPPLGEISPPRGGENLPTKRTPLNDPSDRPPATAAGARTRGLAQQLAAAANRAFDERFGSNRNPILSATAANLLEAIAQHEIPADFAVQAVYEAALKCEREPRSLHYFTNGLVERWQADRARADAAAFVPVVVRGGKSSVRTPAAWHLAARTRDGQPYSAPGFWDLCRTHGLLQAMLTLGTVDEIVQRLQATGAVESAEAFKALVLHVKPWALAEIKFAKTREEQLAAALATFPASTQGAA